jgi:hypothetical protein
MRLSPAHRQKDADVEAAERLCRELGLDDLLARMPEALADGGRDGLAAFHGEQVACTWPGRCSKAGLVILDEALRPGPDTLHRCLRSV